MLTVNSTINLAGQAVPNIIPAVQGDTGRVIVFTLADFTIPAGSTATYYVQKPSGEAVYNSATINDNKVTVELTAQSLAETGDNYGQVRILNGEDVVTSFDFILLVKPFRGIGAIESSTEMNIFDEAVQNAMEQFDSMLPDIIAPEFDSSTAYTAGDYVIYSGKLYQFTTAHAGAWTGTDAEETMVTEKLGGESGDGLTDDIKQALLQIVEKVAYTDEDGQDYYDALETALYPPVGLVSISAVYTQSGTVLDTASLNDLKADLVVTATYEDSSTAVVTTYTLSGTLTAGTSTITVYYGGKTATFTVTVTHDDSGDWDYIWKYEDGLPPASDWTWSTGGGSGQVHEIVSNGMLMTAKSGTNASYDMPYAPASIQSAGGGIAEFAFYIPDYSAMSSTVNAHIFDIAFGDGTNGLRVHLSHPKNQNNAKNIYLYDDSSAWYGGTLVQAFDYATPIVIRLEIDSVNMTGAVYVNGVLKIDNLDLTTIVSAANVKMYIGGCTVNSAGVGAVVQSVKIKYGLS